MGPDAIPVKGNTAPGSLAGYSRAFPGQDSTHLIKCKGSRLIMVPKVYTKLLCIPNKDGRPDGLDTRPCTQLKDVCC